MNLSGKKLTTAILAGLMGATMFGGSVFADTSLDAVQTLANQNSDKISDLTDRVSILETASSGATQNTKDIATNKTAIDVNKQQIAKNVEKLADHEARITGNETNIANNATNISKEISARQDADTALDNKKADKSDVNQKFSAVGEELDNQSGRITTAQNGVTENAKKIEANKQQIAKNVEKLDNHEERISSNEKNIENHANTIHKVQNDVVDNKNAISAEVADRQAADQNLQTQINNNNTSVNNEAAERKAADQNLQNQISKNKTDIANNTTRANMALDGVGNAYKKINTINGILNGTDGTGTSGLIGKVDALQKDSATVKDAVTLINDNKDAIEKVGNYEKRLKTVENTSNNNAVAIGFKTNGTAVKDGKFVHELSQNTEDPSKSVTIGTNLNALDDAISTTNTYVEQNTQGISDNRDSIGKINGILNGTDGTGNSGLIKQVNDNTTGIAENKKAIGDEAKTRAAEDTRLNTKMDKGFSYIDGQLVDHKNQIDKNKTDIQTNAGKIQTNTAAIKANSDKLTAHEERITNDESNIENNAETIKKVQGDVVDEVAARKAADQNLQIQINNNNTSVNNEAAERKAADQNLQNQINNNSTSINDLYGRYSSLKTDINKVGARSAALAGLHPLDFDPANKLNFAVASGSFKGENSVALGAFYRPNENIMFSAASTMGDSDNAYTFGLSFKIGPSSAKTKTTSPNAEELYKVVGELQDQLAAQQKEIEQLKADKAK